MNKAKGKTSKLWFTSENMLKPGNTKDTIQILTFLLQTKMNVDR